MSRTKPSRSLWSLFHKNRQKATKSPSRRNGRSRPSARLGVEQLEQRCLLSIGAGPSLTDTTPITTYNAVATQGTGDVILATFTDANPNATLSNFTLASPN